jgi:hypothetical protein
MGKGVALLLAVLRRMGDEEDDRLRIEGMNAKSR